MASAEGLSSSPMCNLAILDSLSENSIGEMENSWNAFCVATEALLGGEGDLSLPPDFVWHVRNLCNRGLKSLMVENFLCSLEVGCYFHLFIEFIFFLVYHNSESGFLFSAAVYV